MRSDSGTRRALPNRKFTIKEDTVTKARSFKSISVPFIGLSLILSAFVFSACNGQDTGAAVHPSNIADGSQVGPGLPDPIPAPGPSPSDPNHMTIAVKYVALKNSASDAASPTLDQVKTLMTNLSSIWAQCNISFALETYETPVASDDGVDYNVGTFSGMEEMRSKYDDGKTALYVKTGMWNRSSDLAGDGSQGYSTMPPTSPEGIVLQQDVATHSLLVAHETGHLIGSLDHTSDSSNLMDHYVSSTNLDENQCDDARAIMKKYHAAWIR